MSDDTGLLDATIPDGLDDMPDMDDPILDSDNFDPTDAVGSSSSRAGFFSRLNCCKCRNPIAGFLHLFFKVAALLIFVFLTVLSKLPFIVVFVITVVFLAFDFWVVKNVSGRMLVGLLWWNETNDEGVSEWRFLKQDDRSQIDAIDSLIFWVALLGNPVLWVGMAVLSILVGSFGRLLIPVFGVIFSVPNIVGFFWCQKDGTTQLRDLIKNRVVAAGTKLLVQSAADRLTGGGGDA